MHFAHTVALPLLRTWHACEADAGEADAGGAAATGDAAADMACLRGCNLDEFLDCSGLLALAAACFRT